MKISVIIPVYNEEESVKEVINNIKRIIKLDHEIIAINDGSIDNSKEILEGIKDIKVINNPYNLGYGASLKKGIKEAKGEWILIIDADGSYPVNSIPTFLEYINSYDMVVGARTGEYFKLPILRRIARAFIKYLAIFLTDKKIVDINSGFRIFKKEIVDKFFNLLPSGFSFTTTLTIAALSNDYTIKYVPIIYNKRKGKSSIRPIKDFINFFNLVIRIVTYFKPFKVFLLISVLLFLSALSVFFYSVFIIEKFMDVTTIILLIAAIQVFLFGLIADLIIRKNDKKSD